MAKAVVVGDGPGGLCAALFLARGGQRVVVYGQDQTALHYALLRNYLGIDEIHGSDFQARALRQVEAAGADLRRAEVAGAARAGDGFALTVDGSVERADYVVLAGGRRSQQLAAELGASARDGRVLVDSEYRTDVERLYAVGRVARPERSQAVISAGAGAVAALDILATEAGRDVTDWDSAPGA